MPMLLGLTSLLMWLILMVWLYNNSPQWFFVPFFVVATLGYLKMMDVSRD
jgi:hypothetical protein